MNIWVNNSEAGDLRRHRAHYDVIVMMICVMFQVDNCSRVYHNSQCLVHFPSVPQWLVLRLSPFIGTFRLSDPGCLTCGPNCFIFATTPWYWFALWSTVVRRLLILQPIEGIWGTNHVAYYRYLNRHICIHCKVTFAYSVYQQMHRDCLVGVVSYDYGVVLVWLYYRPLWVNVILYYICQGIFLILGQSCDCHLHQWSKTKEEGREPNKKKYTLKHKQT